MRPHSKYPAWVYFSLAFIILQLLDGVLTSVGLYLYGTDMGLEANPIASYTFSRTGLILGALIWKLISFACFFGLLWYCLYIRWSMLDILGLLWRRTPKKDKRYALKCFYFAAIVVTIASLYAGGGWIYILTYLKVAS